MYSEAVAGAPVRAVVSFRDTDGVQHSVEVTARSLYEAVGCAIAEFRRARLVGDCEPRLMTELEVSVCPAPAETHRVPVKRFEEWLRAGGRSPAEQALKVRLRELLGAEQGSAGSR